MGATRRKFTLEFRTEAAHRVIDTERTVHDVAKELSVLENSLGVWVQDERRRKEALGASSNEPLSVAERAELLRLRREVVEKDKDLAFLGLWRILHNWENSTCTFRRTRVDPVCARTVRDSWNQNVADDSERLRRPADALTSLRLSADGNSIRPMPQLLRVTDASPGHCAWPE